MDMATNGTKEAEVRHRPGEEANILGKLRNGLKGHCLYGQGWVCLMV